MSVLLRKENKWFVLDETLLNEELCRSILRHEEQVEDDDAPLDKLLFLGWHVETLAS